MIFASRTVTRRLPGRLALGLVGALLLSSCALLTPPSRVSFGSNEPDRYRPGANLSVDAWEEHVPVVISIIDAKGAALGPYARGATVDLPAGAYRLQVTPACGAPFEVPFAAENGLPISVSRGSKSGARRGQTEEGPSRTLDVTYALPDEPAIGTRFTTAPTPARAHRRESTGADVTLPANAEVIALRRWKGSSGECDSVMVRVVDGGTAAKKDERLVVPAASLAEVAAGPTPRALAEEEQKAKRAAAREAAAKAAEARKAAGDAEVKAGRCSEARQATMQQVLQGASQLLAGMSGGRSRELHTLFANKMVVATPSGTSLSVNLLGGGEMHFYAVGFSPVELSVTDSSGMRSALSSPYEVVMGNLGEVSSKILRANAGESAQVTLKGNGCALLLVVRKL